MHQSIDKTKNELIEINEVMIGVDKVEFDDSLLAGYDKVEFHDSLYKLFDMSIREKEFINVKSSRMIRDKQINYQQRSFDS